MNKIVIEVHKDFKAQIDTVAEHLERAGLRKVEPIARFSCVTGEADESVYEALAKVPGVTRVRAPGFFFTSGENNG